MATYFVGDLQGCYDECQALLERVNFDPAQDKLYLAGDLVARGDKSLECLRLVKSLGDSAQTVLGNHDLHLLSTVYGIKKPKSRDRVDALLNAPDLPELTEWLRQQPLLCHLPEQNILLSHAGIAPQWDLPTAIACAKQAEQALQSEQYTALLTHMYGDSPTLWHNDLTGLDRLRYIINAYTRMRFCHTNGALDFACKAPPQNAPTDLVAWFELPNPLYTQTNIIFGHWASLIGYPTPSNIYPLDTGCVWGNHLTLLRWEDQQYFHQKAMKPYQ